MSLRELERILYFENYVVIDPRTTGLKEHELLTEERYRELLGEYGQGSFVAGMGAEAIRELLRRLDLDALEARIEMRNRCRCKGRKLSNLKVVEAFRKSGNRPVDDSRSHPYYLITPSCARSTVDGSQHRILTIYIVGSLTGTIV